VIDVVCRIWACTKLFLSNFEPPNRPQRHEQPKRDIFSSFVIASVVGIFGWHPPKWICSWAWFRVPDGSSIFMDAGSVGIFTPPLARFSIVAIPRATIGDGTDANCSGHRPAAEDPVPPSAITREQLVRDQSMRRGKWRMLTVPCIVKIRFGCEGYWNKPTSVRRKLAKVLLRQENELSQDRQSTRCRRTC